MYAPVTPNQKLFKLRLPTSGIFISYPAKFTNLKLKFDVFEARYFFFLLRASARNALLAVATFSTKRRGSGKRGEGADWSPVTY